MVLAPNRVHMTLRLSTMKQRKADRKSIATLADGNHSHAPKLIGVGSKPVLTSRASAPDPFSILSMCVQLQSPSFSFSGRSIRTDLSVLAQIRKRLVRPNCQVETPSRSHEEHGPRRRLKFRLRTQSIYQSQPASQPKDDPARQCSACLKKPRRRAGNGSSDHSSAAAIAQGHKRRRHFGIPGAEIAGDPRKKKVATHHAIHSPTSIASLSTDASLFV